MHTPSASSGHGPDRSIDMLADIGRSIADRHYTRRGVQVADHLVRVLLADDHALFRAGLQLLLRRVPDVQVVGEATSRGETLALADRLAPDVLVLDLDMRDVDGIEMTRALSTRPRPTRILALSMHDEEDRVLPMLEAGARGYLSKEAAEHELIDAIRVVASGEIYLQPRLARRLDSIARTRLGPVPPKLDAIEALSERERTVLLLTAQGFGGTEIGRQLGISNKTVETYKQRIEEKLGLRHRTEYVRYALEIGLLHR